MSYLNTINYYGCNRCQNNCTTCNHTTNCGCTSNTCNCSTEAIDSIVETTCTPTACDEGCSETINAKCVILKTYCLINDCNCSTEPINLELFLLQLCNEINIINEKIDCLKQFIPACSGTLTCGTPVITNSIF